MIKKPKQLNIMIHPGEIRCDDGDIHFIGVSQLIDLYGALPSDNIYVYDIKNPYHRRILNGIVEEGEEYPNWIHLYPDPMGRYFNIHDADERISRIPARL